MAGETKKGEFLFAELPFSRVVMRFALHLLAALLLIEEDAGCHEDGTADGERLADESRAVTGLGEATGLGGIRAGEVLRGVCRLLLCRLLCLLSCDLIGKLLLRRDAVGLRLLVGGECRIVARAGARPPRPASRPRWPWRARPWRVPRLLRRKAR